MDTLITQEKAEKFIKDFITEAWCNQDSNSISKHYTKDFIGVLNGQETFNYDDLFKRVEFSKQSFAKNEAKFHETFVISKNRIGSKVSMHRLDYQNHATQVNIFMVVELSANKVSKIWLFTDQDYAYKDWQST